MPADHVPDRRLGRRDEQKRVAGHRLKNLKTCDYISELRTLGVPAKLCSRLKAFLKARHPGDQKRIYHSLAHTQEVASLTGAMLHSWPRVPADRKILLILAAALHDVDPTRKPGTPARVEATLDHLDRDKEARAMLAEFGRLFKITPDQVSALVMATDYSTHPAEMKAKYEAFKRAHRDAFGRDPWIPKWGKRLAYWDQIATYLQTTPEQARSRVAGLGREFRAAHAFRSRPKEGLQGLSHRFLAGLRRDPLFFYLGASDRARFNRLMQAFVGPKGSKARR